MRSLKELIYVIRHLNRRRAEQELEEEMRAHLDFEIQQNLENGMSTEEARYAALRAFGSVGLAKENTRSVWGFRSLEVLWQDLHYGIRMLRNNPGFTAVAVIALALGIGANTAIFSVVQGVLLRPLKFADPERVVIIRSANAKSGDGKTVGVSPADFADWQAQNESFEALAIESGDGAITLTGGETPELFLGARVSGDYFTVLGVKPLLGRTFLPEEFTTGGNAAVILSHRLWQRRFGADPGLVGKSLTIDGKPTTVVGIMPADFKRPAHAEVWKPVLSDSSEMRLRSSRYMTVLARLRPETTLEQAQAQMSAVANRLEQQYAQTNSDWGVRVIALKESLVGEIRPALLILLGAVGFVLLIACANVANLLLSRASNRQKEMAIRAALGATRLRVIRQLLTESVLLALLGGAVGFVLSFWAVGAITSLVPNSMHFPRLDEIRIDLSVLGFTMMTSLLTGIVFGVIPGLQASSPDIEHTLKEGGRGLARGWRLQSARSLLVIGEIALTLLLLAGAGLLLRSFLHLQNTDPGFNPQNLLTLGVSAPMNKYGRDQQRVAFYKEILDRVGALPGVESAALSTGVPLSGWNLAFPFSVEGRDSRADDVPQTAYSSISPNYFKAMGIPLIAGREFTEHDAKGAPRVALINETMARRLFPNEDPVGKRIKIDYLNRPDSLEIVGVVGDAAQQSLGEKVGIETYVPYLQAPWFSTLLVVRTAGDPADLSLSVQREVWAVDKDLPITYVKTMDQLVSESVAQPRLYAWLLGSFAFVALVLAAVGLYGVMSYSVARRTHEIGIRMALGARVSDILRLIVGQGLALILIGVALGLTGAYALTRVMTSLLYGVSSTDPVTFAGITFLLVAVALLASYVPALKATKVDPAIALRHE